MSFEEFCKKNQYSLHQTRSQAFTLGASSRQGVVDELQSKLKAINEYQQVIFKELQFNNPNFELVFNKLEDIDCLSKGNQND
jgi:hypothetical protein